MPREVVIPPPVVQRPARHVAMRFVVLLGVVSLLADVTYEGARSITGPYLALLGATGTAVGIVAGVGELIGYVLRLVFGYLTDRTRQYWLLTIGGYAVNLLAVPLLALAGRWESAALLIVLERLGKAVRTPARDAMLSYATTRIGRGWGFGIHEAMDQIGAVLGPLLIAWVLYATGHHESAFAVLLIPALLALTVLAVARNLYPRPHDLEVPVRDLEPSGLPRVFWLYLAAAAAVAAGYADFPLIAYHLQRTGTLSPATIPLLYAAAMGTDAVAALVLGRAFDRSGIRVLAGVAVVSSLFAPLVFLGGAAGAVIGMALWGIGMGAQESVVRAAVAEMAPRDRRGSAYGIFAAGFGVAWFLGSVLMGVLYDVSVPALVVFSAAMQLLAVPLFLRVRRRIPDTPAAGV